LRHYLPLLLLSFVSVAVLYSTRPYTDVLSRASFATAYPAMVLLAATLLIGPWNWLRKKPNPVSSDLRRDLGIWAGFLALLHTAVGQCVHLRGRPWLYYVYGPA
jgi:sulfoxide reductase heme-binding subunit YedZ